MPLFGYETFSILDQHTFVHIVKPLQFLDKPLDRENAHSAFKNHTFQILPEKSRSLGFKDHAIWLGIEVSSQSTEKLFLSFTHPSLESIEYFIFDDNGVIVQGVTGASIPLQNRSLQICDLRIPILAHAKPLTYLIKVKSSGPLIASVVLGSDGAIKSFKLPHIIALSLFSGVFLALFLYNCSLYLITKQKDYILYSLYILALFTLILTMRGLFAPFFENNLAYKEIIKLFMLQMTSLFLILFTLTFLGIKKISQKLYRVSLYLCGVVLLFLCFMPLGCIGQYMGFFAIVATLIWVLFLGVYAKVHHATLANYYLIAVGGFFATVVVMLFMVFGIFPYSTLQFILPMIGSSWEMILFSLALGHKIRLLSLQNTQAMTQIEAQNKMLFLQSRYTSVGELIRNITHQWKEPLGEMGAIQTNLKSTLLFKGEVSKEKLLNSIELSHKIITHLSETIDTFYRFFRSQSSEQHEFNLIKEIDNVKKIVKYTFDVEQIELTCTFDEPYMVLYGNPNEFSHALLNIILNAKEVLIKRVIHEPFVHIHVGKNDMGIVIEVEDNAGGISQKPIEKIFEIGVSSHEENIGLGLFIAKTIIEQRMRGHLRVRNTLKGAKFILSFPTFLQNTTETLPSNYPVFDIEANTLQRISQLEKDIERHIEVERNLQHWAQIFDKAHWGIAIYEASSKRLSLMNPAFRHMYGYTEEAFKHSSFASLFADEWMNELDEIFEIVDKTHQHSFEAVHVKKNAQAFPVDIDMIAVKTELNSLLYYIVNVRDITQYKNTHKRLLLKTFALEHVHEASYIMVNDRFIQVNEGACKMLGYSREEFASMNLYDIDPDASFEEMEQLVREVKEKGAIRFERRHRTKEGKMIEVEIVSSFFKYEDIEYNFAVARDISERRLLEVQKDNERMRLFFEKQLVGMAITSVDKRWLNVNAKLCEILGYTQEELMELTWEVLTYAEDISPDVLQFEKVLRGEAEGFSMEKRFIHKNGTLVYTNMMTTCVRTQEGKADYFLTLIENITEQYIAQSALKESEQKFRTLIENSTDNISRYDTNACIIYLNPKLEATLGVPREKLIGKTPTQNHFSSTYEYYESVLKKVIATGENAHLYLTLPDEGMGENYHSIQIVAERDTQDRIVGAIAFGRDVTELTKKKNELEKSLELNESIIHAIPDLLFEISEDGFYVGIWAQNEALLVEQKALLLGRNFKDILPEEAKNIALQTMKEVDLKGYSLGNTYSLELPDGKRWFELSMSKRKSSNTYMTLSRDITKRKFAQEALMELTQTLEQRVQERTLELQKALAFNEGIINAMPDLLFELDIDGNYLNVWAQDEELLANQKELLLGKTLYDALSPEAADTVMKALKEANAKGSSFGHIIQIELPSGIKYFEESISKKVPENTFIVLSRDITDRYNAEIELRGREEKFSKLFKLSPAAISITSLETGCYLEVNDSFLYHTKYAYEEVVGKSSAELSLFVNPKDRETFFNQIKQYGFIKDFEYSFRAKDGSIGHAIAYASAIMYKKERCLIGHSYDMSDRKKFKQSEEAFRAIVENSPDVVARYDLEYRRIYVNPKMQQLLNKPLKEIIGYKPSEHTPLPEGIDFEALLACVVQEKYERHFVTPYCMPNKEERWGDIRIIPEFNDQKEVMSILMIGKDLDTYIPPPTLQPNLIKIKE